MRGGLRQAVGLVVRVGEVDIEGTRRLRASVHEQVRRREHLIQLLSSGPVDEDELWVDMSGSDR